MESFVKIRNVKRGDGIFRSVIGIILMDLLPIEWVNFDEKWELSIGR